MYTSTSTLRNLFILALLIAIYFRFRSAYFAVSMPVKKRCLLWDWTSTRDNISMDGVNFNGPISSVSNWNAWAPPELKGRVPFRPMVRQMAQLSGNDWGMVQGSDQPIIQFLNEPERDGVTPEQAAKAWKEQMLPLRHDKGKKLVGPSTASDPAGEVWMADFMSRVADNPPDFLGLHYYGPDPKAAIQYLESQHQKYPQLPVVVNEIACISRDKKQVYDFTAQLANWMDETPWVFEYGFFGCMQEVADNFVSPAAQLMEKGGAFTDLMYKLMNEQPIKV